MIHKNTAIFAVKVCGAFAVSAKSAFHFLSKKYSTLNFMFNRSFDESLTNNIVKLMML